MKLTFNLKYNTKFFEYLFTFFIIITLNFFIPRLMPGDPFTFLSSEEGGIAISYSDEQIEKYKEYYGLDKPVFVQYIEYIGKLFKGDIGYSIYYNDGVLSIILKRMVWTVSIVIIALILSFFIGTISGSYSAWHRNSIFDRILYIVMTFILQIPAFLIGILFLFFLAAKTGWFPLAGGMRVFAEHQNSFEKILDIIHHGFLPVITLSLVRVGEFYFIARNSMMTVLTKDYMRTAVAKGLSKRRIIFRHALKNSIPPVITRAFLAAGYVFGGAILVENVFNYPGIGSLMREAVMVRDYPLIQGIFLFVAISVLTMNFLADVVYKKLDPRVN
ncbi:Glutathione transport system permease protein GsiC [Acetivibrio saccincola]|uniref:Glutathione transport system permease protein GsiC n=2 Tax=Acetivibrio saccincola TaxID=1677857 RepID=A0A2K9EEX9_9FIRM|nr:Glutathione transport system permease protein GsiC [Acetivibrio saccincola]